MSNQVRKQTYYKGKRVDGLGYNLGRRFKEKGEMFIAPHSKSPKSDMNRGYHHCDQVISESVCKDTGLYDSQGIIICMYDIIKDNNTNIEYFVYKVGWHNTLDGSILTDEVKQFTEPTDEVNYNTMTKDSIKITITTSGNYTIVGHLYDYVNAYRYIKDYNDNNNFKRDDLRKYLSPGNFIMTRDKRIFLIQPSRLGLRLITNQYSYFGQSMHITYSARLNHKYNRNMDIMKVHICTNHSNSIDLWYSFFNSYSTDWNGGLIVDLDNIIDWDWVRES